MVILNKNLERIVGIIDSDNLWFIGIISEANNNLNTR